MFPVLRFGRLRLGLFGFSPFFERFLYHRLAMEEIIKDYGAVVETLDPGGTVLAMQLAVPPIFLVA
jgi:hypothetical protein